MNEFLEGKEDFDGFRVVLEKYLSLIQIELEEDSLCSDSMMHFIWKIFDFQVARSKGEILTGASYVRKFV